MITKPYLIQRMKLKNPKEGPTINGILKMDYMGSAEFEFGALPTSLKIICSNIDKFEITMIDEIVNSDCQRLCVIAPKSKVEPYTKYLHLMASGKLNLKVMIYFDNQITWSHVDAWWDIDNDIMFCFGMKLAKDIHKALIATRDKKKSEGWG